MEMINKYLPLILIWFLCSCTPHPTITPIDSISEKTPLREPATSTPVTPTPLPEYIQPMPQKYIDPRIIFVGVYKMPKEIIWQDTSHFKYLLNSETGQNCLTKEFQEMKILENADEFIVDPSDVSTIEECYPQEQIISKSNAVQPIVFSGNRSLAIVKSKSTQPDAIILLNQEDVKGNAEQFEYSVFSISTKKVVPLVASPYNYSYSWLADGEHIILSGIAYDAIPSGGLYIIDINTYEVVTLSRNYSPGEGSVFASFSPDGKFVLLNHHLISTDGKIDLQVCLSGETDYSYAWSVDSQWGYVFCRNIKEDDQWGVLKRINTLNFEIQEDLLPSDLVIKPVAMNISPDNQWLLFNWSDGIYFSTENFGLYLVKLNN